MENIFWLKSSVEGKKYNKLVALNCDHAEMALEAIKDRVVGFFAEGNKINFVLDDKK